MELKPCPFCGCKDISIRSHAYSGACQELVGKIYYYCECMDCDARTGDNFDEDDAFEMISSGMERAFFMWNIRVGKE